MHGTSGPERILASCLIVPAKAVAPPCLAACIFPCDRYKPVLSSIENKLLLIRSENVLRNGTV